MSSFDLPADPLRRAFGAAVERAFLGALGVYEPGLCDYLTGLLTDFAHVRSVYRVKDLTGRPLTEVADMLVQAGVRVEAHSWEREVHKHIGDFVLFWAGLYPESLRRMQEQSRRDHLIDYVRQGKTSYAVAAAASQNTDEREARLLRMLSEEFEMCLHGLHVVRRDMDGWARAA